MQKEMRSAASSAATWWTTVGAERKKPKAAAAELTNGAGAAKELKRQDIKMYQQAGSYQKES